MSSETVRTILLVCVVLNAFVATVNILLLRRLRKALYAFGKLHALQEQALRILLKFASPPPKGD